MTQTLPSRYAKKITEQAFAQSHQQTNTDQQQKQSVVEITKLMVNHVFENLVLMYPYWASTVKTEEDLKSIKKVWLRSFVINQISSYEQVELGFKRAYTEPSDFIPSVTKFISWCKPQAVDPRTLGLPHALEAFRLACSYAGSIRYGYDTQNTPEIIRIAAKNTGYSFLEDPTEPVRKRFEYEYIQLIDRLSKGLKLSDEVPPPLPSPKQASFIRSERSDAAKAAAMESIRKLIF
jgi:hypothetical protein